MTKVFFLFCFVLFTGMVMAQGVPMRAENWDFRPGAVEFGSDGMKIADGRGVVRLKGVDFSDGVIEFDLLPAEKQFASMYFRWKDSLESEIFYFRMDRVGQPQAIQYAPVMGGVNCWNLFDNYQT